MIVLLHCWLTHQDLLRLVSWRRKIKGTVTIHTDGEIWRQDVAWMKELRPSLKPKGAVVMKITDVYSVIPGTEPGKTIL
jgi:predicted pyridoxine 5'-phosphate oxidase superfamily flavin-nucleotide-binding protein